MLINSRTPSTQPPFPQKKVESYIRAHTLYMFHRSMGESTLPEDLTSFSCPVDAYV